MFCVQQFFFSENCSFLFDNFGKCGGAREVTYYNMAVRCMLD
jgi:hypothetical protein